MTNSEFRVLKRKDLLALPSRDWNQVSEYDSLLLCPTGRKHNSGWGLIAIIGCNSRQPVEIAAFCDDICWGFPLTHPYDSTYVPSCGYHAHVMRTDCLFPSGIIHVWASSEHYFDGRFRVHHSLSSTDVELFIHKHGVTQELLKAVQNQARLERALVE